MKRLLVIALSLLCHVHLSVGQHSAPGNKVPIIYVNENVSTHFIFSEPITFVDISTKRVGGDQPERNILRVKPYKSDSGYEKFQGIVTIVGQKYMAQYELVYGPASKANKVVRVESQDGIGLINPEITMSLEDMKEFSLNILKKRPTYFSVRTYKSRVTAQLNNIYTIGDYFFVDVTFKNHSNIKYDIDQLRFKIEDKRKVKRTNFQQIEIESAFRLYDIPEFKKTHRNIYVFKKFTFPNQKVFTIELAEEQISGRTVILEIDYSDILNADTI